MAHAQTLMTVEEFLALPDNPEVRRELIYGELREEPIMPTYSTLHAELVARLSFRLWGWLERRPKPWGFVAGGDARCQLTKDLVVGIDVAYFAPEITRTEKFYVGAPVLAIEIASPSDTLSDLSHKCDLYLQAGTAQVWLVNPFNNTITVHRAAGAPITYIVGQTLPGEPELPGLALPLADVMPPAIHQ